MKIYYEHLLKNLKCTPDINELSEKLFQLGHEHEIIDGIFDMEFTPNRGDCLSLNGLLRDLKLFYDVDYKKEIYEENIDPYQFKFINNAKKSCKNISFLRVEIDKVPKNYSGPLEDYFNDLNVKKNNFFTDISNFISYETGQPTHCYDAQKIDEPIKLEILNENYEFETLLDKTITINEDSLVFFDRNNDVINLAGIIGGKKTSCNQNTKSVLIECAYFDPESIIGKSLKYGIKSDAAHKFERNTDPNCHNYILRRFLNIIESHTNIKKVELFSEAYVEPKKNSISLEISKINKILGTELDENDCVEFLTKLGFIINKKNIQIPSYRNDIKSINDISEEIARAVGYNNICEQTSEIPRNENIKTNFEENKLKKLLIDSGFYEVVNDPFVSEGTKKSVIVDNPLDSNRKFLRTDLKDSLLKNLLYNERRQKDIIKLFEIADIYNSESNSHKRVIGIIASGRVNKNYLEFSKKIDQRYIEKIFQNIYKLKELNFINISRESINSKIKNSIIYLEIEIDKSFSIDYPMDNVSNINNIQYIPISDYPSSSRDLSFSIKDFSQCKHLEKSLLNFQHDLIKEIFIFDYFKNEKLKEIKIGFRFVFQSKDRTITENDVNNVMDTIIASALSINSISIPGLAET